ncbi:hypothetical protein PVAP13_8KG203300 [Panicum virgatum]|uniref:Uncharacterized protein n=1 Tax=Panicum virgatum TaxID=38727 RepID=A0A8T0PS15_PANVG|nr:hypothetical protein PVAP13_8KG203300 [Panicum virgatum]
MPCIVVRRFAQQGHVSFPILFFYLFESYLTQYIESRFICFTYWAEISWKLHMVIEFLHRFGASLLMNHVEAYSSCFGEFHKVQCVSGI